MATINPFQGPINYAVDVQSPFEAAIGGFKIGAAGAEAQAQRLAAEQVANNQKALKDLYNNPNATGADYDRVAAFLPKDQAAIVTQGFERKTKEQQQNDLRMGGQVYSAVKSGQIDIAKDLLKQLADAQRNSGRADEAKATETSMQLLELNPTSAQTTIGLYMARLPGGKDILESADKALSIIRTETEAPAELRKKLADAASAESAAKSALAKANTAQEVENANRDLVQAQAEKAKIDAQFAGPLAQGNLNLNAAQIKKINSEISNAAVKLNLDTKTMQATVADKLSSIQARITELPADSRKLINDAVVQGSVAKQSAAQFNDLAARLQELGNYGKFSNLSEYAKGVFGAEGYETSLRQEYIRLRNQAAIKSLPPGPATDKDIELALRGFPKETADAKNTAAFLRGMAKLQEIDAASSNAKADWLSQNNGALTRAKNTFIAGDYTVKPGETFNDFTQRVVVDVSKRYRSPEQKAEEDRAATMAKIPTTGTPAAAPVNIRAQADAILSGGR